MEQEVVLEVKNLKTYFYNYDRELRAVDDLSYKVHRGECVAIIGESGSGKTVSALSILRLVSYPPGLVMGGQVLFKGQDLLQMNDEEYRQIRGSEISMIFQEPSAALNPVATIGAQIAENIMLHSDTKKEDAWKRAVELLTEVGIPNAEERVKQYPFEFSGGMQQRAMIAMAMSCNPEILIADEPTTALDVTVQAQVLEQLNKLRRDHNMALILITHNLGVVARYADSVKIMYGGKIVEDGSVMDVFRNPAHPYTLGLIRAVPRLDLPRSHGLHTIEGEPPDMSKIPPQLLRVPLRCKYARERCRLLPSGAGGDRARATTVPASTGMQLDAEREEVLQRMSTELNLFDMPGAPERPLDAVLKPDDIMYVQDLKMHFPVTRGLLKRQVGAVKAVDGVTFTIKRGQTLGIVGESGSGKSTVGNCLLRNLNTTGGHVYFEGHDMQDLKSRSLRPMRKQIQMITQDPFASLDPRMNIQGRDLRGTAYSPAARATPQEQDDSVVRMLEMVGSIRSSATAIPHEFSGGQRQRISIARALALQPNFIVCDEVVSALDVSIQAQVVTLLMKLQQDLD